ncbi:MAG: dihydropteroate synthase [Armatimonadetes bacterium]|nr:dihydropteroate synthase [Armatimonadota bacterium]
MIIIGERINGMFKAVSRAIKEKDKKVIQDLALKQIEAGAQFLDVNVGPAAANSMEAIEWLVKTIQEAGNFHLSLDSTKPEVIEAGLKLCKAKPMINSTTAQKEKLDILLPLAKKYNASLIGLTMNEKGVPSTVSGRTEMALQILAHTMEYEIPISDLYIDPLILPVNVAQDQASNVLEAIRECKLLSDPPPHLLLGLSNVSQKTLYRELINRTYVVMAITMGLDSAILDPFDKDLMDAVITAELLLNKDIYCDSYLDAYRRKEKAVGVKG